MSALAPTLQAFFTDRLINQRDASPHTIAAYRDTLDAGTLDAGNCALGSSRSSSP